MELPHRRIERPLVARIAIAGACLSALILPGWQTPARCQDGGAEHEVVEPVVTRETLPVAPGVWDLRLVSDYRSWGGNRVNASYPLTQLLFGITDRLGAEVGAPLAYGGEEARGYGFGDVAVSLKWLLARPSAHLPGVVLGAEAAMPTGSVARETGEGIWELTPYVGLVKDFGSFSLQGNAGRPFSLGTAGGQPVHRYDYNWALAVPLRHRGIQLLGEINGITASGEEPGQAAFSPGVHIPLARTVFFGAAVPVGLNPGAPAWGIVFQFQFAVRAPESEAGESL